MARNRKQPVPKSKNARKSTETGSSPPPLWRGRRRCGSSSSSGSSSGSISTTDTHAHYHLEQVTDETILTETFTSFSIGKRKSKPEPQPQKWEPMAHSCGVCNTKTTSKQFKRTCFEKHEYVCDRFHRTLLRSGKTDSCAACVQEMEMDERRTRELEAAQKALEELKLEETATTGVCAKRNRGMSTKLKKAVCKVEEMEDRLREIKWNTESELKEREAGFLRWKS